MRFRWNRASLLVVALALLAACASPIRVSSDFDPQVDFKSLRTWDWVPDNPEIAGPGVTANSLFEQRVAAAIEQSLAAKGYTRDPENPSFRVGFTFATQDRLQVRSQQTGTPFYGYGRWSRGRGGFYRGWGGTTVDVRQYTEGTLVIDIAKPGGERLIWRGTGTSRIRDVPNPEERIQMVNETVAKILAKFPPG